MAKILFFFGVSGEEGGEKVSSIVHPPTQDDQEKEIQETKCNKLEDYLPNDWTVVISCSHHILCIDEIPAAKTIRLLKSFL